MFTDLFTICQKKSKQLRGPSVGEWIDKLWYNHKMEYYSVLKKK